MTNDQDPILLARKFEEFFHANYSSVKHFARFLLKSETDAEDIAQEVFAALWQQPKLWLGKGSLKNYLFVVTKNTVFNYLKHKNIEQHYIDSYTEIVMKNLFQGEGEVLDEIYLQELQLILRLELERMPEKRRQIFMMSRYKGMRYKEISDNLQISIRTVEQQVYLAISSLKKVMYAYSVILCVFFIVGF